MAQQTDDIDLDEVLNAAINPLHRIVLIASLLSATLHRQRGSKADFLPELKLPYSDQFEVESFEALRRWPSDSGSNSSRVTPTLSHFV